MGSRPYAPKPLEGFAKAIGRTGEPQRAIRILAAVQAARDWMEINRPPIDQPDYKQSLDTFKLVMGEENFRAAWKEGTTMTIDQAMVYALEEDDAKPVH